MTRNCTGKELKKVASYLSVPPRIVLCLCTVAEAALVFVCLSFPTGAGQMIQEDYSYAVSSRHVNSVFFLDSRYGWATLDDEKSGESYVFRTSDGGMKWTSWRGPRFLEGVFFLDTNSGWALQDAHVKPGGSLTVFLLHTSDGGKSWRKTSSKAIVQESNPEDHEVVVSLGFLDARQGWFVGEGPLGSALVIETSDGGKTFRKFNGPFENERTCIGVYTRKEAGIWIYGNGYAMHSTDRGRNWIDSLNSGNFGFSPENLSINSAVFLRGGSGWLVGGHGGGVALRTENYGNTWTVALSSPEVAVIFEAASFYDQAHGCIVGNSTKLICTADGGATWSNRDVLPPPQNKQLDEFRQLVMLKSGRGWIVRAGGYLYETIDAGHTWRTLNLLQVAKSH